MIIVDKEDEHGGVGDVIRDGWRQNAWSEEGRSQRGALRRGCIESGRRLGLMRRGKYG